MVGDLVGLTVGDLIGIDEDGNDDRTFDEVSVGAELGLAKGEMVGLMKVGENEGELDDVMFLIAVEREGL